MHKSLNFFNNKLYSIIKYGVEYIEYNSIIMFLLIDN